jgi:hypothetical protein
LKKKFKNEKSNAFSKDAKVKLSTHDQFDDGGTVRAIASNQRVKHSGIWLDILVEGIEVKGFVDSGAVNINGVVNTRFLDTHNLKPTMIPATPVILGDASKSEKATWRCIIQVNDDPTEFLAYDAGKDFDILLGNGYLLKMDLLSIIHLF